MSNREIALDIINTLSEEQLQAFITLFASDNVKARMETEKIANEKSRKHYDSFEDVTKVIFANE